MTPAGGGHVRDRDAAGRPRNARPRDALGRPLPRGAGGEAPAEPSPAPGPAVALRIAQGLLDEGRPFEAHEVLESVWKASPEAEREFWRGLTQIAVGITHARRGNMAGAVSLLRRGGYRVGSYAGADPHGVRAAPLARQASALADRIAARGLARLAPGSLTITLLPRRQAAE